MDIKEELSKLTRYSFKLGKDFCGDVSIEEIASVNDGEYLAKDAVESLVDKADAEIDRLKIKLENLECNYSILQEAQRNGC